MALLTVIPCLQLNYVIVAHTVQFYSVGLQVCGMGVNLLLFRPCNVFKMIIVIARYNHYKSLCH